MGQTSSVLEPRGGGGRIVVGVDGSENSKDALRWAAGQARLTGARLDVVMTWEVPVFPYGAWSGCDVGADAKEMLDETVHEVLGGPGTRLSASVMEGRPASTLLEAAKEADLLVVGRRGHGSFTGFLLGSVAERCVTHAPCPVVVVHHHHEPA